MLSYSRESGPAPYIVKLSDTSRYYVTLLEKSDFPNAEYKSEKLKHKLLKHELGGKIAFISLNKRKGKFSLQLIFSTVISQAQAITTAYNVCTEDSLSQVEARLRDVIRNSFHNSEKMPWPHTASYLQLWFQLN